MPKRKKTTDGSKSRATSETEDDASSTAVVKINVGGTLYEVSRSLLQQHPDTMLSRMASDTWQEDPARTLFVERDGARFRYVLDFMRDGKVSLPGGQGQGGITKSSLLDELTYFGFEGVGPGSVQVEFVGFDAPKYMARLREDFERGQEELIERRDQLNVEIASAAVANACAIRTMGTGCATVEFDVQEAAASDSRYSSPNSKYKPKPRNAENYLDFQAVEAVQVTSLTNKKTALNAALEKYGLQASNYEEHSTYFRDPNYSTRHEHKLHRITMQICSGAS